MEQGTLLSVTSDDVREAADRIGPYVRTTPVFATEIGGRPVTLKLENLQVTGSFKFRGTLNGVLSGVVGDGERPRSWPAIVRAMTIAAGGRPY
jgi:threonine dehydratase